MRAILYGLVLEYCVEKIPVVNYFGWLFYFVVFALPGILLVTFRHWIRDPISCRYFFGLPFRGADLLRLFMAGLVTFGVSGWF